MQVPIFRAKDIDSKEIVEGFYFEYPLTNQVTNVSNLTDASSVIQTNMAHCLLTYKPGVMGLINEPTGCTIDITTLELVKYVEIPCRNILL